MAPAMDVFVHAPGIRPVGFGGDGLKSLFYDQPLCEERACLVELVRAVRSLADQNEIRIAHKFHRTVEIGRRAFHRASPYNHRLRVSI